MKSSFDQAQTVKCVAGPKTSEALEGEVYSTILTADIKLLKTRVD